FSEHTTEGEDRMTKGAMAYTTNPICALPESHCRLCVPRDGGVHDPSRGVTGTKFRTGRLETCPTQDGPILQIQDARGGCCGGGRVGAGVGACRRPLTAVRTDPNWEFDGGESAARAADGRLRRHARRVPRRVDVSPVPPVRRWWRQSHLGR